MRSQHVMKITPVILIKLTQINFKRMDIILLDYFTFDYSVAMATLALLSKPSNMGGKDIQSACVSDCSWFDTRHSHIEINITVCTNLHLMREGLGGAV